MVVLNGFSSTVYPQYGCRLELLFKQNVAIALKGLSPLVYLKYDGLECGSSLNDLSPPVYLERGNRAERPLIKIYLEYAGNVEQPLLSRLPRIWQ